MVSPHSSWQTLGAGGLYGGNVVGSGSAMPVARSELEAARMGTGSVPSAAYPDGYLGTIRSRRDDRLLDSTKNRVNQRSYQRGVHKGERIDPGDYRWPEQMQPDRGLRAESKGKRTELLMDLAPPPNLVNDGKTNTVADQPYEMNLRRQEQLTRLLPSWR